MPEQRYYVPRFWYQRVYTYIFIYLYENVSLNYTYTYYTPPLPRAYLCVVQLYTRVFANFKL